MGVQQTAPGEAYCGSSRAPAELGYADGKIGGTEPLFFHIPLDASATNINVVRERISLLLMIAYGWLGRMDCELVMDEQTCIL